MTNAPFDYAEAFSRNVGWVTENELQVLRHKRVAIAGAGGVGGVHLLTLTRLGIGAFNLSDFDSFEQANFNRQFGAMMSTVGQDKVEVMASMARDINPQLSLRSFPEGVNAGNVDEFLRDVDLYVDALDFFAFDARMAVFAACARKGIPAITVAPLGMGAALLNFLPGGMTFEAYFGFEGRTTLERMVRFMVGLAPKAPHRQYLVDPSRLDLAHQRCPSTPMGVQLCAGVAGSEAVKILLGRGKVLAAPHGQTFDAYLNRYVTTWRPGGHRHPLTQLSIWLGHRFLQKTLANPRPGAAPSLEPALDTMTRMLDLARWAPSGDNDQPWQFEVLSPRCLRIHLVGHSVGDLYDYQGIPCLLSLGCLTENLRLAAGGFGLEMDWHYEAKAQAGVVEVCFTPSPLITKDPLCDFIPTRSVDRRHYLTRALSPAQKAALERAAGEAYTVVWLESRSLRWRATRLNAAACQLRLSIPETISVHQRILDFSNRYSLDRIPSEAIGMNPVGQQFLRWVMADAGRARFFMCMLPGGTVGAQIEMEVIPGLCCGAHFMLVRREVPAPDEEETASIRAGMAIQRFWLAAVQEGLALHPSTATVAFAHYGRKGITFSATPSALERAQHLAHGLKDLCTDHQVLPDDVVFMGRIGTPPSIPQTSRSLRKPLTQLIIAKEVGN